MTDINSIALAISSLKSATDIVAFFRQGDLSLKDAEQKMKLADLMSVLADLKTQLADAQLLMIEREGEIRKLKEELELKAKISWEPPYYWVVDGETKDGPFCQQCKDSSDKLIRLQDHKNGHWACKTCKSAYIDKNYTPPPKRNSDSGGGWMSR
jgi:hypothetical protein